MGLGEVRQRWNEMVGLKNKVAGGMMWVWSW